MSVNVLGKVLSSDDTSITTKVSNSLQATCGDDNTAASIMKNVSVDLKDITCDDLNVLTQQSSIKTLCVLRATQHIMNENPHIASAPVPTSSTNSTSQIALYIAIVTGICVVIGVVAGVVIYLHKHGALRRSHMAILTGEASTLRHLQKALAANTVHPTTNKS